MRNRDGLGSESQLSRQRWLDRPGKFKSFEDARFQRCAAFPPERLDGHIDASCWRELLGYAPQRIGQAQGKVTFASLDHLTRVSSSVTAFWSALLPRLPEKASSLAAATVSAFWACDFVKVCSMAFTITSALLWAMLDHLPMEDRDTKGDLYEYMLGKIASAGQNRPVPHAAPHHQADGGDGCADAEGT